MDLAQRIIEVAPSMNKEVIDLLQSEMERMWNFQLWGLIACGAGFMALLGWIMALQSYANKKASYDWVKDELKEYMLEKVANSEFQSLKRELDDIKFLLQGIDKKIK